MLIDFIEAFTGDNANTVPVVHHDKAMNSGAKMEIKREKESENQKEHLPSWAGKTTEAGVSFSHQSFNR